MRTGTTIRSNQLQFGNAPSIAGDKTTWPRRIATTPSPVAKLVGERRGGLHVEAEKMPPIRHQARRKDQSRQERCRAHSARRVIGEALDIGHRPP